MSLFSTHITAINPDIRRQIQASKLLGRKSNNFGQGLFVQNSQSQVPLKSIRYNATIKGSVAEVTLSQE